MTGLDAERDHICEIGMVWGADRAVHGTWSSLVNPGVPMPPSAQAVHGLSDAALAEAPPLRDVLDTVLDRMAGALVIAHHAPMDVGFLTTAARRCGRVLPAMRVVDTLVLARRVLALRRHRLIDVAQLLGLPVPPAHRALDDARATFDAFGCFVDLLDPDGQLTVRGLERQLDQLRRQAPERGAHKRALEASVAQRRPIQLTYVSRDDDGRPVRTERTLSVWKVRATKLEGFCHLREEPRIFRLDRVLAVRDATATYRPPEGPGRLA